MRLPSPQVCRWRPSSEPSPSRSPPTTRADWVPWRAPAATRSRCCPRRLIAGPPWKARTSKSRGHRRELGDVDLLTFFPAALNETHRRPTRTIRTKILTQGWRTDQRPSARYEASFSPSRKFPGTSWIRRRGSLCSVATCKASTGSGLMDAHGSRMRRYFFADTVT